MSVGVGNYDSIIQRVNEANEENEDENENNDLPQIAELDDEERGTMIF